MTYKLSEETQESTKAHKSCHSKQTKRARNIGDVDDTFVSMENHVTAVCKAGFYHLRNISHMRKYISRHTTEILVHALITSRLDFCNSLLYALPKRTLMRLQHVQNVAARIVTLAAKCEHISPVLYELHWLPVQERIVFKILLMTFKCLIGLAPSYFSELIQKYIPPRNLRFLNSNYLTNTEYKLCSYGLRSFSVASSQLWNSLPLEIRSCDDLNVFKKKV